MAKFELPTHYAEMVDQLGVVFGGEIGGDHMPRTQVLMRLIAEAWTVHVNKPAAVEEGPSDFTPPAAISELFEP